MSGLINDIAIRSSRQNPEFKAGTKMVFNQTAAPTGWTKVTSANDVALRLVTGSVGTGGSVAFETAFASHTPTISMTNAAVTLATATVPAHTHTVLHYEQGGGGAEWTWDGPNASAPHTTTTSSYGSGGAHTHSNSASSSAVNLDVSYVDVIIATKD